MFLVYALASLAWYKHQCKI